MHMMLDMLLGLSNSELQLEALGMLDECQLFHASH